jgi:hypothetical protein
MNLRKTWTDDRLASELLKIANGSGIMPTNSMLRQIKRTDIASQLTKRGGFIEWANRLGLTRELSDSDIGWDGEKELAKKLSDSGFDVTRMDRVKSPYDLCIENAIRIDVKSAKYAEYGVCKGWFYRIAKNPQADVVALYQIDTGDCYYLPWQHCPTSNVTISRDGGKYKTYKNREDILNLLVQGRKEEETLWSSGGSLIP